MMGMRRDRMNICIYGSAAKDIKPVYIEKSERLGEALAKRGHVIVFGGGAHGLMGATARGVKRAGGKVIGIIPAFSNLKTDVFPDCDELIQTETIRQRKQLLEEKSDAFIILPGGLGTFDELFETIVLKSLRIQRKPMAVYNINGYFNKLQEAVQLGVEEHFIPERNRMLYTMFDRQEEVIVYLEVCHKI